MADIGLDGADRTRPLGARPQLAALFGSPWWLTAPALGYAALVFALPLASLVATSFVANGEIGLSNYAAFLSEPHYRQSVWITLRFAALTSIVCVAIGLPYGLIMSRLSPRWQAILLVLILIPMASSIVVRTFGWTILLRRDGIINDLLVGTGLAARPVRLIFTEVGLVLGTVSMKLPLVILPVFSVARMIPKDLVPAALCLGATPVQAFTRITVPLVLPGVLLGFAFVFAQSASAYVVPSLLAGTRYKTMSMTIVESYSVLQNAALGSTVSVLLLVIVISVIATSGYLARRVGAAS